MKKKKESFVAKFSIILHFVISMLNNRHSKGQQQKSVSIFSTSINTWKVRPVCGFEKHLFPSNEISVKKYHLNKNIDPSRFIYPRDAMGNMLVSLFNRISIPFYLPKYESSKPRSPIWTIRNAHNSKKVNHQIRPMTYNSINDKSQLSCKTGWTQRERYTFN